MKLIKEDYLDAEKQFWDYRTKELTDGIVFDTTTTGTGYDYFITNPKVAEEENKYATIEYMTPMEYFKRCADIFNSRTGTNSDTAESLVTAIKRDRYTYSHLLDVLTVYKKTFPIGWLNYADMGQEGMHRMAVAGEYSGWDIKQPVLVIRWIDEKLAMDKKNEERREEETRRIRDSINRATDYRYSNIEEFRQQLQYELNREYDISYDEDDVEFSLESDEANSQFIIKCGIAEDTVDYDEVKFVDHTDDEDVDDYLSNIDLDELEDVDADEWLKKYLGECFTRNILKESIEKHDKLNPLIWDGEYLRTDVRVAILEIVNKYIEDSEVLKLEDIIDIELLGSNASYNYTKDSDLDIHLVVNMDEISSDPALVQIACNAEKSLFNKAYQITVKGIDIELYVEDVKTGAVSNGVFSVSKNEWLKKPVPKNIPDLKEDEEYLGLLDAWMIKAKKACSSKTRAEVLAFINELYNLRRISIMTDGEYALGNLVFKEIRNHGILQDLKDLSNKLASKELSLESLQ